MLELVELCSVDAASTSTDCVGSGGGTSAVSESSNDEGRLASILGPRQQELKAALAVDAGLREALVEGLALFQLISARVGWLGEDAAQKSSLCRLQEIYHDVQSSVVMRVQEVSRACGRELA